MQCFPQSPSNLFSSNSEATTLCGSLLSVGASNGGRGDTQNRGSSSSVGRPLLATSTDEGRAYLYAGGERRGGGGPVQFVIAARKWQELKWVFLIQDEIKQFLEGRPISLVEEIELRSSRNVNGLRTKMHSKTSVPPFGFVQRHSLPQREEEEEGSSTDLMAGGGEDKTDQKPKKRCVLWYPPSPPKKNLPRTISEERLCFCFSSPPLRALRSIYRPKKPKGGFNKGLKRSFILRDVVLTNIYTQESPLKCLPYINKAFRIGSPYFEFIFTSSVRSFGSTFEECISCSSWSKLR